MLIALTTMNDASANCAGPHPLHRVVAEIAARVVADPAFCDCTLIMDPACGGRQRIPLFSGSERGRRFQFCNVDILVLKDGAIRAVFEIEESNVKPTQVCGKLLTAALSDCLIHDEHGGTALQMHSAVTFIQVLDTSGLRKGSAKIEQWHNLERCLRKLLPLNSIADYHLFHGDYVEFEDATRSQATALAHVLQAALK